MAARRQKMTSLEHCSISTDLLVGLKICYGHVTAVTAQCRLSSFCGEKRGGGCPPIAGNVLWEYLDEVFFDCVYKTLPCATKILQHRTSPVRMRLGRDHLWCERDQHASPNVQFKGASTISFEALSVQ